MFVLAFASFTAFLAMIPCSEADPCHLRELDICAANGAGAKTVPVNDADIDKYCGLAKESKSCVDGYFNKCATNLQKELIAFVSEGPKETMDKFCKKGEEIRTNYLKHAACLAKTQPDEKKCTNDLHAALEKLEEVKHQDRIPTACCAHVRNEKCSTDIVQATCGKDAVEYGRVIIKMASGNLLDSVCNGYEHNPRCATLLPPPGSAPKGNSKSIVTKLFKLLTKS